jgi:hypothetical protein
VRKFAGIGHLRSIGSVSPADYDNDGDTDWYATRVAAEASQGNILFRNEGDGTVTDVGEQAGVRALGRRRRTFFGAQFFDYDNDGWLDLFVPNGAGVDFLFRNQGDGGFREVTDEAGLDHEQPTLGVAPGDIDGDGDLDLFTSIGAAPDAMYRNLGDGSFRDEAAASGIGHAPDWDVGRVRFFDADNDGDLDLFGVSGDPRYRDLFYRNQGDGTFIEEGEAAGLCGREAASIGLSTGDFDNDGYVDLFVTVAGQRNSLYINLGGVFVDRAVEAGLPEADPNDDLQASAGDFNNDGFLDLFVNNFLFAPENALFENQGNDNNWLHVELAGTVSNRGGIGARVQVRAGELVMVRYVSHGQGLVAEFGFAGHRQADEIEVRWPSGLVTRVSGVPANQNIRLFEDRAGFFRVEPTVWEQTPIDSTVMGARIAVRAQVRPALFEQDARIKAVTADLSDLGGSHSVPLTDLGTGSYRLDHIVTVAVAHGLKFVPIRIEQSTSLGPWRTTLTAAVVVSPGQDEVIYDRGIEPNWSLESNSRVEVEPVSTQQGGRTAMRLQGSGRLWRVELTPGQVIEPAGYHVLRFAFHPGDATLPSLGARFSVHVNLGGQIVSLLDGGVDLARKEWQVISVPMSALNVETPIEFIRWTGNLNGTFYIADVSLVAAVPPEVPTLVVDTPAGPASFALAQNAPNPFNGKTRINFDLSRAQVVDLRVFNLLGQTVRTLVAGSLSAGRHSVGWDGRDQSGAEMATGVYVYRLQTTEGHQSRNLLLLR